jgi:formylglycine-generating enzyme required for sulfatase activity
MTMADQHVVNITELAVLGEQFPQRLMQLGFRFMQVIDGSGRDQYRYVTPPVCKVPGGPFLMGSNKQHDPDAQDDETPQHTVTLETYHIGIYPLTVAEYACFVQATDYATPDDWGNQERYADHPIVYVPWRDALAYTQWLTQVTGEPWRLPTEAEWEKAARGADGRIYPWGDLWEESRANIGDGRPRNTTPVGSYPTGASPYGAQDMVSNVWEWTSTQYHEYPYSTTDGRENVDFIDDLVLRGGAWGGNPLFARAAYRYNARSSYYLGIFGARLVRGGVA